MLNELLQLTPMQFEHLVADLLRERGFLDVRRIGGSGDLGVDLIARDAAGDIVAVQCERYAPNRPIGSPAIQTFFGMIVHRGAERGIYSTTSRYTPAARKLASERDIELIDAHDLIRYYAVRRQREWEEQERRQREQIQAQQALVGQSDGIAEIKIVTPAPQSPVSAPEPLSGSPDQQPTRNPFAHSLVLQDSRSGILR